MIFVPQSSERTEFLVLWGMQGRDVVYKAQRDSGELRELWEERKPPSNPWIGQQEGGKGKSSNISQGRGMTTGYAECNVQEMTPKEVDTSGEISPNLMHTDAWQRETNRLFLVLCVYSTLLLSLKSQFSYLKAFGGAVGPH